MKIGIGGSAQADGAAFVAAWKRIEGGGEGEAVDQAVSFQSWEALAAVMTRERLRLLRHLHRHRVPSIAGLAKALGRPYRRVHEDVAILERSGLLVRDGDGIGVTAHRIEAVIELA